METKKDPACSPELYRQARAFERIGNRAVRKAQARNRELDIPNVYSHQGRLYYELPSGELTLENPFDEEEMPSAIRHPGDA